MQGRSPSPQRPQGRTFEMQTPGTKLAQEIHDEFLCCKICLEPYKTPKSLNCLHTFCEECVESHIMSESTYKKYSDYREFTCPICRKRTQLPLGGVKKLPDNFLVSNLSDIVVRQRPSKYPFCDICKMVSHKHREAASKCLDCAKLLCADCVAMHKETKVTSAHSIFDVEIEKDIECKEHAEEVVRFYCEPCETCICVLCTFNEHKDHEITQFKEAVCKYKENITTLLTRCEKKIENCDAHLASLTDVEKNVKEVEQQIHDTAIQFIQEIRNKEKQLIEELQTLYGPGLMKQIENKKDLSAQVDALKSTCKLTEVILKGKDIELLLLKKDVQEKLQMMNEVDVRKPPSTIAKRVNFVVGSTDLGLIHDMDSPLMTTLNQKSSTPAAAVVKAAPRPECKEKETQTGAKPTAAAAKPMTSRLGKFGRIVQQPSLVHDTDSDDSVSEYESDASDDDVSKVVLTDSGVQTDKPDVTDSGSGSDADESGPEMADDSTMTDKVRKRKWDYLRNRWQGKARLLTTGLHLATN